MKLNRNVDFLLSRRDIYEQITSLTLTGWTARNFAQGSLDEIDGFRSSIFKRLQDVLEVTRNVRHLTLSSMMPSLELLQAALALPRLSHLTLVDFQPPPDVIGLQFPPTHLEHLSVFYCDPGSAPPYWFLLPAMPRMRWFELKPPYDTHPELPAISLPIRVNPFTSVERVFIHDLASWQHTQVTALIQEAVVSSKLPLTHLKLCSDIGYERHTLFPLITALSQTSVRYLSLDGIGYAEPDLLNHIVLSLPQLTALTLVYRESPIQHHPKPARWPQPVWEYASLLSGLSKLEYFGWNIRIDATSSPVTMLHFEEGFDSGPDTVDDEDDDDIPNLVFDGRKGLPALFAAYCPSLKTMAFVTAADTVIVHSAECGTKVTEPKFEKADQRLRDTYDPDPKNGSWPVLDPAIPF